MVKRLCQQLEFKAVHVAFDNFFSSPSLMKDLTAKKIYSTGTVSANHRAATSCKTEVKKGARMGGVDRFDQKTGCYSVSRRSKR